MNPNARHAALPLYMQISETLIRDIASGRYVDGERLPPERELAKAYGTTVRTLRKALKRLVAEGLLERIQGSGNYVRQNRDAQSVYSMFRLELPGGGGLPTADVLSLTYTRKPADLPEIGTSDAASVVRRLRRLDGIAIAVEEIWLDGDCGRMVEEDLSESLYLYYQRKLGFWISHAEDVVWSAPLPDWTPDAFGLRAGETAGYIERRSWAQGDVPVEFSRTWFDPDRARYVQRLG